MYEVVKRLRRGTRWLGKYITSFKINWPPKAKHVYLVSYFTSFFPGRYEMRRKDNVGSLTLSSPWGEYPYAFLTEHYEPLLDKDAELRHVDLDWYSLDLPVAYIGVEELKNHLSLGGIHPEDIVHDEGSLAYVHRYLGTTVLRLCALHGTLNEVSAFAFPIREKFSCDQVFSDGLMDCYECWINKEISGYLFYLNLGGKTLTYGLNGLKDEMPFRPKLIGPKRPTWWLGSVYYSIFPDSFDNGDPSNDPPHKVRGVPRERGYLGGDLAGILRRLTYIKELGVDAIYLTPIYESASYHRYDVINHKVIDPYLGNINDFRELVTKIKNEGIKLILDLVVHHKSPCSPEFRDALTKSSESPYWSWFRFLVNELSEVNPELVEGISEFINGGCKSLPSILKDEKPFYEGFANLWSMPKLNPHNPAVIDHFKDIIRFWIDNGVSGFRVDVGLGMPDYFLKELNNYLKNYGGEDKVFIIETMHGVSYYPIGAYVDSAMNYDLRHSIIKFFIREKIGAEKFVTEVMKDYIRLPLFGSVALYNLLGSHDVPRIKEYVKEIPDGQKRLLNAYAFLFIIHGSPAIYYGDEVGMEGGKDPDCRRPMIWDEKLWDKRLLKGIKELIKLRKSCSALKYGFTRLEALDNDTFKVERIWKNEVVTTVFSRRSGVVGFENSEGELIYSGNIRNSYLLTRSRGRLSVFWHQKCVSSSN